MNSTDDSEVVLVLRKEIIQVRFTSGKKNFSENENTRLHSSNVWCTKVNL